MIRVSLGASWSCTSPKSVSAPDSSTTTKNQRCLDDFRVSTDATTAMSVSCRGPSLASSAAENPRIRRSVTAMWVSVGSALTVVARATTLSPSRRKNRSTRVTCSASPASTSAPTYSGCWIPCSAITSS